MEPCPHPFPCTFLTVVGVYRRLRISIVLFRGILFRGVTIKPIPTVFHIVRFAVNGNRFRVDIALRKLGLPLLGEHRVVSLFVHGAYRIHTQDIRVCATRDIIVVPYEVVGTVGEVFAIFLLERGIDSRDDGVLRVIGRRIILIIGEVV